MRYYQEVAKAAGIDVSESELQAILCYWDDADTLVTEDVVGDYGPDAEITDVMVMTAAYDMWLDEREGDAIPN